MKHMNMETTVFDRPHFFPAEILLPDFSKESGEKWACVACDQFTSEPAYWEEAHRVVGDAPSTLRLILPEVYLSEATHRIPVVNQTMDHYLKHLLIAHPGSMIYLRRSQTDGRIRRGVLGLVDLEEYDYRRGSASLIRATEGTVLSRIPPRVAIRRGAALELPHVMLLIDDPDKRVIEPLEQAPSAGTAYDFELMLGGGHVKGSFLTDLEQKRVTAAMNDLIRPEAMEKRYGRQDLSPLLFAVGDGNHSLAAAKAMYEEIKESLGDVEAARHPARYALCEVVNLHDEALTFEPIYRAVFGADEEDILRALRRYAAGLSGREPVQHLTVVKASGDEAVDFLHPVMQLTVGTLQAFLDDYTASHPGVTVDYIHDESSLRALTAEKGALGFLFAGMKKEQLFKTVICDGALPRKTFSMGHARDKRYYLEARKIRK